MAGRRRTGVMLGLLAGMGLLYAAALAWSAHEWVFLFAWYLLPVAGPCAAWLSGAVAVAILCRDGTGFSPVTTRRPSAWWAALATTVCMASYALSLTVFTRLLELPWRAGKFGEHSLSLGAGAARLYAALALGVFIASWALFKAAHDHPRAARYGAAAMGRLVLASVCYLGFGLGPLVDWRA